MAAFFRVPILCEKFEAEAFLTNIVESDRSARSQKNFWRPPLWKWVVLLLLLSAAIFLLPRKPQPHPVKVELLPFDQSIPTWDGSYPSVIISVLNESGQVKLKGSILKVVPTVTHDGPVNQFEVALDSGMFKVRQSDIFVPDFMPLVLTRAYRSWDENSRAFGVGGNHPYDICPNRDEVSIHAPISQSGGRPANLLSANFKRNKLRRRGVSPWGDRVGVLRRQR